MNRPDEVASRIAAIHHREETATKGPWTPFDAEGALLAHCYERGIQSPDSFWRGNTKADGEFIAHAREDVPWLLDQLTEVTHARDRLQQENEKLQQQLRAFLEASGHFTNLEWWERAVKIADLRVRAEVTLGQREEVEL